MLDALKGAMAAATSGMRAQTERTRVVAENLANADSTASEPGGDPYRRRLVSFAQTLDEKTGASTVQVKKIIEDQAPFKKLFDPSHPMADEQGYVAKPNVDPIIEMTDMRESQRSYDAALKMFEQARGMEARTLDILRA